MNFNKYLIEYSLECDVNKYIYDNLDNLSYSLEIFHNVQDMIFLQSIDGVNEFYHYNQENWFNYEI